MDKNKKRYVHDCKSCRFIGRYKEFDVYICNENIIGYETILARHSDDGSDYLSSNMKILKDTPFKKEFFDFYILHKAVKLYEKSKIDNQPK
jgi:hypothetical protein